MNETWLAHHGILGQRWGIRRYQNEDGSLTPAGERRYDDRDYSPSEDRRQEDEEALRKSKQKGKRLRNAVLVGGALASVSILKSTVAAELKMKGMEYFGNGRMKYHPMYDIPKAVIKAGRAFVIGGATAYGITAFRQDQRGR